MKHSPSVLILLFLQLMSQLSAQQKNDVWNVFGETRIDCKTGTAKAYTYKFNVPINKPLSFTIQLVNGDGDGRNRAASATVKFNGVTIISPAECNQETKSITKVITIQSSNTLQITVNGATGSFLKITCLKHLFPIQPIVECVKENGNGTYTANYGYSNNNTYPVAVPIGLLNLFLPLPINRGQPTIFQPGRQRNVFSVVFNGKPLIWQVRGRIATASSNPLLACGGADTIPPTMSINAPANGMITSSPFIQVNGMATDVLPVTVSINGSNVTVDSSGTFMVNVSLSEGLNPIAAEATDAAGNTKRDSIVVIRDTQVPVLHLLSPMDSLITNQEIVNVIGTVIDSTSVELKVNGELLLVGADGAFSTTINLIEGLNTVRVIATDAAGNITVDSILVIRDTRVPIVDLQFPIDSSITNQQLITVSGIIADTSAVSLTINGIAVTIGTDSTFSTQVTLLEGLNTITVLATDAAGNQSTVIQRIWRDTQLPVVSLNSPTDSMVTNQESITFNGTVKDSSVTTLTINGLTQLINPDGTFSHTFSVSEGQNRFVLVIVDAVGNRDSSVVIVIRDTKPPVLNIASLTDNLQTTDSIVKVLGSVGDSTNVSLTVNNVAQVLSTDGGFNASVFLSFGSNILTFVAADQASNTITLVLNITRVPLPPDPKVVAPPLDTTVTTLVMDATEFLYTGANPIQAGVIPGTINKLHLTVLKGRVLAPTGLDRNLEPLSGTKVTILDNPEFGYTFSRPDGMYDIVVNGGGEVKVNFEKAGYLPAQRQVTASWGTYARVDDAVLMRLDTAVHRVDFTQPEVVQGTPATDSLGTRRPSLFFNQGTQANLVFTAYKYKIIGGCVQIFQGTPYPEPSITVPIPIDSFVSVNSVNVRILEYTVGPNAELLIPVELPQTIAYTFAFELTADEMLSTGAKDLRFNQPVSLYLENVMNFPVGFIVPMGCFNREKGFWETSENGRVIKILDTPGGIAAIDNDGDNIAEPADTLVVRGISLIEQQYLATTYPAGQSIWRAEITHLGTYAGGFGMIATDAVYPQNPLPDRYAKVDRDNIMAGSVIGVQNQTLGESVPITNTPMTMSYKSDRVVGRREAYCLDIPLTGNTIPQGMSEVTLSIEIVGRKIDSTFAPQPNLTYHFEWDGKDAYGRRVQGQQNILTEITYIFPAQYTIPPDVRRCFATPSGQIMEQYIPARKAIKRTQIWEGKIGAFDILSLGIGGWSLSLHHGYDCVGKILYKGTGEVRSANVMDNVINTIAGVPNDRIDSYGDPREWVDGNTAAQSKIGVPTALKFSSDGSLFYSEGYTIIKIDTAGIMSTVAGKHGGAITGISDTATGILANCAIIRGTGLTQGSDGSWYYSARHVIWRISPEGEVTRFAGIHYDNVSPYGYDGRYGGDGGPALDAYLNRPGPLAFGKDGSLYFGDTFNYRIRKISPDGTITTVAGTGVSGSAGDGGPAILCTMEEPRGLTIAPDGSVLFCDYRNHRVRRITPDGIVRAFAGNGNPSYANTGDGGLAVQARLIYPNDVSVAKDGTVFIESQDRIRGVAADGYIKTVVGGGNTIWLDNGPATACKNSVAGDDLHSKVGPDGNLYVAEWVYLATGSPGPRIFKVTPPLPGITLSEILIASEDGSERCVFTYSGRHLRTLDALTGVTKYTFGYNSRYKLVTITDIDSLVTRIERDSSDNALAIISPYGVRTNIILDSLGYLVQAVNPANESNQFTSTSGGLITSKTDARGNTYHFEYDTLGYLTRDADPAGGCTTLNRTYDSTGYTITSLTAMGKKTTYRVDKLRDGTKQFTTTDPNGLKTIIIDSANGNSYTITPEGMNRPVTEKPDPRFGMQSPLVNAAARTPGGIQSNVNQFRTVTQMTGTAVTGLQDSISVNGKPVKVNYDGNNRILTKTSPEGRKTFSFFDAKGRIVKDSIPGLLATIYTYDNKGRKIEDNQGGRKIIYEYDSLGRQSRVSDPYGRNTWFFYDLSDRLVRTVLPDSSKVLFTYDHNGNMLSLTPPSKPEHTFDYSDVDLETQYIPPFAGDSARVTTRTYTLDKEAWKILRPDSLNITLEYGGQGSLAGIPKKIYFDRGMLNNLCDTLKGQQIGVVSAESDTLKLIYDGTLLKKVIWTGTNGINSVKGDVAFRYNSDQQVITETVTPTIGLVDSVNLQYDNDGLLKSIGVMKLKYGTNNSLLLSDTVGNIITNYTYDSFGALASKEVRHDTTVLFRVEYVRDCLSRITEKTENAQGSITTYAYSYDAVGRLSQILRNDTLTATYEYDQNGNRLARITPTDTSKGVYDSQDRLLNYSSTQYFYSQNGDLLMKVDTVTIDTTRYSYDGFGSLRSVTLPNGMLIEYLIDGSGRRVGRKVSGVVTQKWVYSSDLRIIAELDSANNIIKRFIYTAKDNLPEYMIKSGVVYRIISDHVGSLRFVVNTSTGAIMQQIDYDEYGNISSDSSLDFTPFGFAGGQYDEQTKLVRFGARDYDVLTGRWTIKDPIRFMGNCENLYRYNLQDPINNSDPEGLWTTEGHAQLTKFSMRGYDIYKYINIAVKANIGVDEIQSNNALHYMPEGSQKQAEEYIQGNLNIAVIFESIGYSDMAAYFLGLGLHTLQDKYAHWEQGIAGSWPGHVVGALVGRSPDDSNLNKAQYDKAMEQSALYVRKFIERTTK